MAIQLKKGSRGGEILQIFETPHMKNAFFVTPHTKKGHYLEPHSNIPKNDPLIQK